jgi:uncharacterized membrane protein YgcG
MHGLDNALGEFEAGLDALESGEFEFQGEYGQGEFQGEFAGEYEEEWSGEYGQGEYGQGEFAQGEYGQGEYGQGEYGQGEYQGEYGQGEYEYGKGEYGQGEWAGEYEYGQGEFQGEQETVFDEVQEMELAAELLGIHNEEELEQFLGKLIKSAGRAIGGIVRSPIGKALGGALKNVARVALPMAGKVLGNMALPGVGGIIGGKLASAAGGMFGLELEGMSAQDQEFEVARRVVRLAGESVKQATQMPLAGPPTTIAKDAVLAAAARHAPGLAGRARAKPGRRCRCGGQAAAQEPAGEMYRQQPRGPRPRPRGGSGGGSRGYGGGSGYGGGNGSGGNGAQGYGGGQGGRGFARSGSWFRRGNTVVLTPGA